MNDIWNKGFAPLYSVIVIAGTFAAALIGAVAYGFLSLQPHREILFVLLVLLLVSTVLLAGQIKRGDAGAAALHASEARFRDFAAASGDWFWETDAEGRFVWRSDSVERITAVPAAWRYGKRREEIAPASNDLSAEPWRPHLEALAPHEPFCDFRYRRAGSKGEQWISTIGVPRFDETGRFLGYRGLASDITERVEAERRARLADERLRAAIEHLNEAVALTDADDRIVYANRRFREATPAAKHCVEPGRPYVEYLRALIALGEFPDASGREEAWLEERLHRRHNAVGPIEIRRAGDRWRLLNDQRLPGGGIITVTLDITERKRAEQALAESEARFRSLTELSSDGYWEQDEHFRFTFVSLSLESRVGLDARDFLGKARWEIPAIGVTEEDWVMHRAALHAHQPYREFIVGRRSSDGSLHYLSISGEPVFGADGRFKGYHGVAHDITEGKQAEDGLKRLAEELKAVSVQLAHAQEIERHSLARELHDQIGQSLTALGINLNLIRGALSPEAGGNLRARLDDSLELVEGMTERVRDVMAALRPPMLDDYGVLAALRWHAGLVSERTGLAIRVEGPEPQLRLAAAAEIALFRIAQEALVNIIKHSGATQVAITLAKEGEGLRLSIEDNGTGFQVPISEKRGRARGWGLVTIRERAESVGGKLRIESAPAKGTMIIVEIAGGG